MQSKRASRNINERPSDIHVVEVIVERDGLSDHAYTNNASRLQWFPSTQNQISNKIESKSSKQKITQVKRTHDRKS